jgi:hypothetical protein
MSKESKNVYVTFHKSFVKEGIPYTDAQTGEQRTFNSVTLPKGTVIDGRDVSYFEFSPRFINESRKGENYRDIPLLKDREVWLQKTVLDSERKPILNADGTRVRETIKVMPEQIRFAMDQQRREYLDSVKGRSLHDRAEAASRSVQHGRPEEPARNQDVARDGIAI